MPHVSVVCRKRSNFILYMNEIGYCILLALKINASLSLIMLSIISPMIFFIVKDLGPLPQIELEFND